MDLYNIFGTLNTIFITVSLFGVYSQLRTVWQRKQMAPSGSTELLSTNQFTVSYLAYLSFFIYGYSIEPFNHYIVWPRLVASILVTFILYEIWLDRRNRTSQITLSIALITLLIALLGLLLGNAIVDEGKVISTSIIIIVSALIAQGYFHQIRLIINTGKTGAVDLKMSQFILLMDISTIAFAFSMGLNLGWPLLVLAVTSAITKLIIMYLFHWVKVSETAKQRRLA